MPWARPPPLDSEVSKEKARGQYALLLLQKNELMALVMRTSQHVEVDNW